MARASGSCKYLPTKLGGGGGGQKQKSSKFFHTTLQFDNKIQLGSKIQWYFNWILGNWLSNQK